MASADPYDLLGVARDASQKEIQKAYRRLAKKLHPDLNPGDKEAQRKFQDLSAAYDILGDETKRARFDRGEIDASGAERPQRRYYRDFAQAGGGSQRYENSAGFADFGGTDDILSAFFSQGGRRGFRMRVGDDRHYRLDVDFLDAVNGATRRITLPDGSSLDIVIPPGTRDGQTLRLAGKGDAGPDGGEAGDALIEIAVRPHPFFKRDGDDIRLDLPISLTEAVLGGKVTVPTPAGPVTATIPKWSNTGKVLRLKGRGVPGRGGRRGDEYLTLQVMLPDAPDPELEAFVSQWPVGRAHNPRRKMGGVMLDATEFCQMTEIRPATLEAWIEAGWLRPRYVQQDWRFSMIDLARARLILDLRGPMGVNDEGIGVILDLVDQIHGLRRALRAATSTKVVRDVSIAPARTSGSTKSRRMAE